MHTTCTLFHVIHKSVQTSNKSVEIKRMEENAMDLSSLRIIFNENHAAELCDIKNKKIAKFDANDDDYNDDVQQ